MRRNGVRIAWESHGTGTPALLLMPTWSIFPARHWKFQVPFLARSFRVVTFDGPGNGGSDRPAEAAAYADTAIADDAVAVLDAAGVERAIACGVSMGAGFAVRLAVDHPERVLALVLLGPSIATADHAASDPDSGVDPAFDEPSDPEADDGWGRYNAGFWRRDWPAFASWFVGTRVFSEPHSTKHVEDGLAWALGTDAETMIRAERAPYLERPADWPVPSPTEARGVAFLRRVAVPSLVIQGIDDRISSVANGRRVAGWLGAELVEVAGGGHAPNLRDPVRANLAIRDFARRIARTAA